MRYGIPPEGAKTAVIPEIISAPWCDATFSHAPQAWESAARLGGFSVRMNGREPDAATEALAFSDGRNLQIAFRCAEPKMDAALAAKDGRSDHVIVFIDPGLTRREFRSFNQFLSRERSGSMPPDEWMGAAKPGESEWTGQIAIPFAGVGGAPEPGDVWGLQLGRVRYVERPYGEVSSWSPADLELRNPRDYALVVFRGGLSEEEAECRVEATRRELQAREDSENRLAVAILGPAAPPAASAEVDLAEGSTFDLGGKEVRVAAVDNPEIARSSYPFFYERADHPELDELRRRYELDRVIEGASDDFDEAIRLQLWVIDHMNFGSPAHHDYRALRMLSDCERGKTFYCTHFSYVFMQCCQAVGINCRKVSTIGHASDEFWSNRYRKWLTLECTRGHYFEKDGVPLSALEVHNEYARNKGVDMDYSVGTEHAIRKVNLDLTPDGRMLADAQERYLWFAALMRNDLLSVPFELGELRWLWWRDDANRDETEMEVHIGSGPTRFRDQPEAGWEPIRIATESKADLYWTLNTARLHIWPAGDELEIRVETQTPNFARFEREVDAGEWERSPEGLTWRLHEGENALSVRPVCAFGRPGIPASVKLVVR